MFFEFNIFGLLNQTDNRSQVCGSFSKIPMNGGSLSIQVSQLIFGICSRENQENSTVQINHLTEDIGFLSN